MDLFFFLSPLFDLQPGVPPDFLLRSLLLGSKVKAQILLTKESFFLFFQHQIYRQIFSWVHFLLPASLRVNQFLVWSFLSLLHSDPP
jgi:hypothetical protein